MTSYAPVVTAERGGGIIRGQPVAAGYRFNGYGAMREQWWWEDGPMGTCCFCCTLRTGVGLLAASDVFKGVVVIFVMRALYVSGFEAALTNLQEQSLAECQDNLASLVECEELNDTINDIKGTIKQFLAIVLAQGFFCLMAGGAGLWAVSFGSARAAKVYMLSWPANYLLGVLTSLQLRSSTRKYLDVELVTTAKDQLHYAIHIALLVYYFKVCWSYYKVTLDHEQRANGGASRNEEQPMIAMNVMA